MMLIPSEIGQDPTTYQLDGRDNLRVKYDEDMLSGVIEQQVDGAWESTGQLVTPEYKNDDFFGGIVGFTIADDIPNASTSFPISTPLDSSTQFPALSDRDRQLLDSSGGFQAHEGGGMVILGTPYPTDPSLSAPMPGFPADSGVKPAQVMMNESSESAPNSNRLEVGVVDEYGIAKAQTGDGSIHRDHQPSKAALIARAEELKGDALTPAERNRIINGGMTVNVPANVHRAGPTYGGKNTAALINSDKSDLASAAARDANAMVENARILSPEHAQVLEESSGIVKQRTNAEYDKWLLRQFDDD
jgi:hypothetical protein